MDQLFNNLVTALEDTYALERELGGGGMSRVFLAEEKALGRKVVIKVLPPDLGAGFNVDRFRREIKVAAPLQHPHIVPLLAAGQAGGQADSRTGGQSTQETSQFVFTRSSGLVGAGLPGLFCPPVRLSACPPRFFTTSARPL